MRQAISRLTRSSVLLDRIYSAGVHGIYVCGNTREGLLVPPADKHVIVHVGAAVTSDAVGLARHVERIGAHAISSLPPGS